MAARLHSGHTRRLMFWRSLRVWSARAFLGMVALLFVSAPGVGDAALAEQAGGPGPSTGAAATSASSDYNLIFISLTNTRADHLGAYGYSRDTSTNLDALARRSLLFQDAFTHASWTLPVVMSLFTSQYPFTHGLMNREENGLLPVSAVTLVDVLKTNGYVTAAFVGSRDYSQKFGLISRFHRVFDPVNRPEQEDWKSYGVLENTLPPAREWLRANKDRKFFLLVQGYDTHCPFSIPKENGRFDPDYRGQIDFTKCYWTFEPTRPIQRRSETGIYQDVYLLKTKPTEGEDYEVMFYPEDVRHMVALYDGEIYNADRLIGGLLDEVRALGLEKRTIIVFYSDHGDMFGKHGRFMRGGPLRGTFYDDVLHIPLIIQHPAIPPGSVHGLAQVVDLAPTLLEWMGVKSPPSFQGKSLVPLIRERKAVNEYVFAGSAFTPSARNPFFRHNSVIVSARSATWKLILERVTLGPGPRDSFELYDLAKDPAELRNVAERNPEVLRRMKAALYQWLAEIKAESLVPQL